MNHERNRQRSADIVNRVEVPDHMYSCCRIIGCASPPTASTNGGLNRMYCRKHEDHFERHGSYTKGSYSAIDLNPHRKLAADWLTANQEDLAVIHALRGIEHLFATAGPLRESFRLRGLTPRERAKACWSRLRQAKTPPVRVLASWLAIESILKRDPQAERKTEYRRVQAAKLIHRMASGTHKRWTRQGLGGRPVIEEMHKYPSSRGRVLRHIGEQLEKVAELLTTQFLATQDAV